MAEILIEVHRPWEAGSCLAVKPDMPTKDVIAKDDRQQCVYDSREPAWVVPCRRHLVDDTLVSSPGHGGAEIPEHPEVTEGRGAEGPHKRRVRAHTSEKHQKP